MSRLRSPNFELEGVYQLTAICDGNLGLNILKGENKNTRIKITEVES